MKRIFWLILAVLFAVQALTPTGQCAPERPLTAEEKNALLSTVYEADIADLRRAIDLELITCRELTEYYLRRIEVYNSEYNCFITLCDDALEQAELRDRQMAEGGERGALFGIPVVVKDNIHVAGYPTTNGHKKIDAPISEKNAAIVENLLAEGAVILGKTNMSTNAQDAFTSRSAAVGETKNAYSVYLSPGGSSGGSAAAVSLNFAVAALGTDTNSSLRIPAAWNGCVALRVTRKLINRDGIEILNNQRDVPGAITRCVADQAILLDVMTGGSYRENLNGDVLDGMRIGILEELCGPFPGVEQRTEKNISGEVMAAFENAVEELRSCGAEVVRVSMPELFELSEVTFPIGGYRYIPTFTAAFEAFLKENQIAAVIFPSCLSNPLRSGVDAEGKDWSVYGQPFLNNCRTLSPCAAVPEITVPIGQHSLGAGIGMEIAAASHSEQLLLDIAYSYTLRYDHRPLPEGAPDAYAESDAGDLAAFIARYEESLLVPEPEEPAGEWKEETGEEPAEEPPQAPEPEEEIPTADDPEFSVPTKPPEERIPATWAILPAVMAVMLAASLLHRRRKRHRIKTAEE